MKRVLLLLLILLIGVTAFAESERGHHDMDATHMEIESILSKYSDIPFGEVTLNDVQDLAGELSIPMQQSAYVQKARIASMIMPGMGQFITGDTVGGALYAAADVAIAAGTMVGLYFLLPPELQFDQLNYFTATHAEIKTAWQTAKDNMTFANSWPIMSVAAGSMLLQHGLRFFSARQAADRARANIADGTVKFEPRPMIIIDRFGGIGFGMGMRH